MYEIIVPATSANLGPGFDSFGLALGLYNRFIIGESRKLRIEGCEDKYKNRYNLVYTSALKLFRKFHNNPAYFRNLYIKFDTAIPTGRGLGSSATCIIAGLAGANMILGSPYTKKDLFLMACEIEGHPDNISPALYGGFTVSSKYNDEYYFRNIPVKDVFDFYVLIPDFPLSTKKSRAVVPAVVPLPNATLNVANASLMMLSLIQGDLEGIKMASQDYLYEVFRKKLIRNFDGIKAAALSAGALCCMISGAGPSLLCITKRSHDFHENMNEFLVTLEDVWKIKRLNVDPDGVICKVI
ncbi:MAG: homoserine kinase [Eubacteriaceae bacterium]|nr:homoserine kinase [Eubacteriaceae bacterium]